MFGKVILACLFSIAFLLPPNALPGPKCCANPKSHQVTITDGCCAAMPCCIISGDNAAQLPTMPAPTVGSLASALAPVCLVSLIDFPASAQVARFGPAPPRAHSLPPLALSGIFLI
ncbi:MAG: hypothetical protein ABI674_08060 [Spartobacteria bacterium]